MKRKILLSVFLVLFFVVSLTFSLGMVAFGESKAGGNEVLSNAPQLKAEDGSLNRNFLADLSSWINDRFFLRQEMITLDNVVTAQGFGTSGEKKVIVGKDGWLFFADTLEDYTGTAPLSERELFGVIKNIQLMDEYCKLNGRDFAFVIAPNKNSVYGEFMPDYGVKSDYSDALKVMAVLKQSGVKTPDLFSAINSKNEQLYFKNDSHWNSKGAALGADVINNAFGKNTNFFGGEFLSARVNEGDLYSMLYPALRDTEIDWCLEAERDFVFAGTGKTPTSITITTESNKDGKLLAYRDSFGNLLFPYLAESYGECYFSRKTAYDLTMESDYVMVEIVERNLDYLLKYTPIMPSPEREVTVPANSSGKVSLKKDVGGSVPEGYKRIEGVLPITPDNDTSVYVISNGTVYEAFVSMDNGFVAYIPETAEAQSVVFGASGQLVRYDF